ncbi:MAG: septum formation family protein [Propionicimonas sp.]
MPTLTPTVTTSASSATPSATVTPLKVGDCTGNTEVTSGTSAPIEAAPCDGPHFYEVFAILDITDADLPTVEALEARATKECLPAFRSYVGVDSSYSRYSSIYLAPDSVSWQDPAERRITCLAGSVGGGLVGSVKNDTAIFPALGECTGPQDITPLDVVVLSCKGKHSYEVYAEKKLTSKAAPTGNTLTKLVNSVCAAGFTKFVGVSSAKSKYEYTYFIAEGDLWPKVKDHRLVCSVGSPAGGIKGSLKGVKK